MTSKYFIVGITFVIAVLSLIVLLLTQKPSEVLGGAFPGTASNLNYATTTTVGPQGTSVVKTQVFAANTSCKSRVISTPGTSAIMISFNAIPKTPGNVGSTTVSASVGHLQAASTTIAYDSEIYGCGTWNVWAWASTSITVSEFN